jgi:putative FmdB family regulatory protein
VPIYEYTCEQCQTRFEQLVRSMSGSDKFKCPKCGSGKTARTLSVFAVGAEQAKSGSSDAPMCGRCGGPGPCAME